MKMYVMYEITMMNYTYRMLCFYLFCTITWSRCLSSIVGEYTALTANACFRQHAKTLHMSCEPTQMVRILSVLYGHSNDVINCQSSHDQCEMTPQQPESYTCVGWQTCQVNLPSGGRGRYLPRCEQYSSYMQVRYECVPVSHVMNMCQQETVVTEQRGFIITPGYPHNYQNSLECQLHIELPRHNTDIRQKIQLHIIDMNLEANDTDCADWLNTFDGFRSITLCGRRTRQDVLTTMESHLVLTLHTNGGNEQKGFWLYFEAIPYVDTGQADTTSSTTLTPVNSYNNRTKQINKITSQQIHDTCIRRSPVFVGVIVALITTTILCVILAFTSITLLKRRHGSHKKMHRVTPSSTPSTPTQEMRSKASRNVWYINNDIIPLQSSYIDRDTTTGEEQLFC